jgi:hypothetical protein
MIDYLKGLSEETPRWLTSHRTGVKPNLSDFFGSRVVYYPGAGLDGQPVRLFNQTHSAHCFMYVDYLVKRNDLEENLVKQGFTGYDVADVYEYSAMELAPRGWQPHVDPEKKTFSKACLENFFCALYIMRRKDGYGDEHGAETFAFMYLKADAIATYDALFANRNFDPPFCMLIEDYGLGGQYAYFDGGYLLEEVAFKSEVYPQYYLMCEHEVPWNKAKSLNLEPQIGGMHDSKRYLYKNTFEQKEHPLTYDYQRLYLLEGL